MTGTRLSKSLLVPTLGVGMPASTLLRRLRARSRRREEDAESGNESVPGIWAGILGSRPSFLISAIILIIAILTLSCSIALGDEKARVPAPPRSKAGGSASESNSGWWFGPAGIAAALMVFGGLSVASKRFLPNRESGPIQVVGRSSLSPKHSVTLVRVGNRVLIVGTGPQGPPSTLGEVTDPAELARLIPQRVVRPDVKPVASNRPSPSMAQSTGFDRRIGDDE